MARNNINSVLLKRPKRNKFDLSRVNKLTCEAGEIVPFFLEECLPDDSFKLATANRIRLAPQVLPLMHQIDVSMYWFFVPCRILWPNWEEFITGGKDGTSEPIIPYFNFGQGTSTYRKTSGVGFLSDYLGIPTNASGSTPNSITSQSYNFMPFAAYVKIYNDYFRDENFTDELPFELKDGFQSIAGGISGSPSSCIDSIYAGPSPTNLAAHPWQRVYGGCFLASWKKEYFTSALPNTQRGPIVNIPLGDTAPVVFGEAGQSISVYPRTIGSVNQNPVTGDQVYDGALSGSSQVTGNKRPLQADLSEATNTNIIELRRAFRIQEFLERMNAGGSRLTEMIYSMFGVKSPDARLQRAEFIGASHNPVLVDAIYQTSASQENSPLADFAGKAISVGGQKPISYYCKEHGYILGLMVIRPRSEYQNITRRHWLHGLTGKFDYFWPILANIGDQAILNRELYPDAVTVELNSPFGYTPRYQEYRFAPSETHGEMQTTLKYFHMNRIFNSNPVLNQQFMNCNPRTDMFAVTDGNVSHHYWCEILIGCQAKRPIPKFGTPML
jgi:hypothetical protein